MRKAALALVLLTPAGLAAGEARDCRHQAERRADLDAGGATLLQVVSRAGSLEIEGRAGLKAILVRGTACADEASVLERIQVRTERAGGALRVVADVPETSNWLMGGNAALHLVLEVPPELTVEVEDGSGALHVRNVASARIKDGSGEIVLERIAGEVRITDGSGSIEVREAGAVVIDEDGSGSITIAGIRGSVTVRDDGSGSIDVRDVAGDFTVDDDGSGGVQHAGVRGRVRLPRRH